MYYCITGEKIVQADQYLSRAHSFYQLILLQVNMTVFLPSFYQYDENAPKNIVFTYVGV